MKKPQTCKIATKFSFCTCLALKSPFVHMFFFFAESRPNLVGFLGLGLLALVFVDISGFGLDRAFKLRQFGVFGASLGACLSDCAVVWQTEETSKILFNKGCNYCL